jgi:proteic killer suppression protein
MAGMQSVHANRLHLILGRLNAVTSARDMNLPGLVLHALKGDRKGLRSVEVSGNRRITFTFTGKDAGSVNYADYH